MTIQYETTSSPRFTIQSRNGVERLVIRPRCHAFIKLFLGFWLCMWTFAGWNAGATLLHTHQPFMAVWMCFWALGWLYAISALCWFLVGTEILSVRTSDLEITYGILGYDRTRLYRGSEIRDISPSASFVGFRNRAFTVPLVSAYKSGCVKFNYGARTIFLGEGLDEAEGKLIVAWLRKRLQASAFAQA
jgi:hypothetical protein